MLFRSYDKTGLIYGIGHAVYTLSDPRAVELKRLAGELAKEINVYFSRERWRQRDRD